MNRLPQPVQNKDWAIEEHSGAPKSARKLATERNVVNGRQKHLERCALENWFTFTPGEMEQFFACSPHRKGLVGLPAAYGSGHFTDTHFHQCYFVHAAGLLSQLQPDFAAGWASAVKKTRTLIAWNPIAKPQTVHFLKVQSPSASSPSHRGASRAEARSK